MPKRYNLYVDGQNVPVGFIPKIMDYCSATGAEQERARLYGSTTDIERIVRKSGTVLADYGIDTVSVQCKPRKNSVDIKMAVDIIEDALRQADCELMVIATNDSDFTHIASKVISYRRSELHLLHTGEAPSGYSDRVKMTRLSAPSKREKVAGKVKKVAAVLLPAKPKPKPAPEPAPKQAFVPDPDYTDEAPIITLGPSGFAMRIMAASPVVIDSRCMFQAWKDFSGQPWKSKNSKKTADQFLGEHFPPDAYRFVQWSGQSANQGCFLSNSYESIHIERGLSNAFVSILGAPADLIDRQAVILAEAIRERAFDDFNGLYDGCRERNLLPRYAALGLLEAWHSASFPERPPVRWMDPVPQDASIGAESVREAFDAEVRRRFEAGDLALEPRAGSEEPADGQARSSS